MKRVSIAQKGIVLFALLFAFSLPLSRAGINLFGLSIFIFWLIEGRFKEKFYAIVGHTFTKALLLFILYLFVVLFWVEAPNIKEALKYDFKYIYFLVILVLFTSYDTKKTIWLLYAFLLGMFVSVLQSLSIYFHIYDFHEVNHESLSPHMWHTIYSIFLSFSALTTLVLSLEEKSRIRKGLFGILSIMIAFVLFAGVSRTGELIYLLGILYLFIRYLKPSLKTVISGLIMIALFLTLLYTQNSHFKSRVDIAKNDIMLFEKEHNYCSSLGGRLFTWRVAYDVFKDNPLLGLGTIDHIEYLQEAMNSDKDFSQCDIKNLIGYFHAQYIELTAQSGLVGLLLLLYLFYTFSTIPIKSPALSLIKSLLVLVFLSAFLVDVPFRKMFTLALFALITSIILLQEKDENAL